MLSTSLLQPLDVSFMRPLSVFYDAEVSGWLRTNPGRVVSVFQIAKLFGNAFIKAATMSTAINGFRKTGIWPCNPNIFTDADFLAAETTDRPISQVNASMNFNPGNEEANISSNQREEVASLPDVENVTTSSARVSSPMPGCSWMNLQNSSTADDSDDPPTFKDDTLTSRYHPPTPKCFTPPPITSPEDIMPIPHVGKLDTVRAQRKRGKTVILTDTPYKDELEEIQNKRFAKESKKQAKTFKKTAKKDPRKRKINSIKNVKARFDFSSQRPRQRRQSTSSSSSAVSNEDDAACLYCNDLYSESTEGWVQCRKCRRWAHCSCAGEEEEDDEVYHICTLCQ